MVNIKRGFNSYVTEGDVTIIFLENNKKVVVGETKVDTEFLRFLLDLNLRWYIGWSWNNKAKYVTATEYYFDEDGNKKTRIHRLHRVIGKIAGITSSVDHKDNDTFNNRMSNLRESNKSLNGKNRKGRNSNNTSGYRNVTWINGHWRVQLQIKNKNHLFSEKFNTPAEAGRFAEKMRNKYYKKFAGRDE